jgi:hypothetical protein
MKKVVFAAALAAALFASASAFATTITGSLQFGSGSPNFYDQANGFVPGGFGNTGGTAVAIGAGTEFGFMDGANFDTANFTENSLVLTDVVSGGATNWTQIFTANSAGFFNSIALGDNNFSGLTYGVANDTLTVNWVGTEQRQATYAANFTFGGGAVPEPATWAMMILGFGLVGGAMRSRRSAVLAV